MASIRVKKDKDGKPRYHVQIRKKGLKPITATFTRRTDAERWARNTEAGIDEGRHFKTAEAKRHTVGGAIERYINNELIHKPKLIVDQTHQLNCWKQLLGELSMANLTVQAITEAKEKLINEDISIGKKRSNATIVRYMAAFQKLLSVAVNDWGWIEDNPMKKVSRPKEPSGRIRFLSDDKSDSNGNIEDGERTRLLRACEKSNNSYLYIVVVIALSTGMRKGELLNLAWSDVDFDNERITLHKTKNGEIRVLPLKVKSLELLLEHSKVRHISSPLVFPSKENSTKPTDIRKAWDNALKSAEITDFRFHDLRHSAASYLAMDGASMLEISEILGHKTLQMVKRYAHLSETHTANIVASMNDRIFR